MMAPRLRCCLAVLLAASAVVADVAGAAERILSYHSDITVHPDASMMVVESVRVRAEGDRIRRGVYRDFPTDYRDSFGNRYRVDFQVMEVARDGNPEPWRAENLSNGVRVYAGSADRFLEPGEYTYVIRYRTSRQLGFFEDHDELYWNVTGNGWVFPIESAGAVVNLPQSVPSDAIEITGFAGVHGSRARNAEAGVHDGKAWIETGAALRPGEGLTLVVTWPKGYVEAPTAGQKALWLLRDNRGLLIALAGLGLVVAYLYLAWARYGRDPLPGVIFPHYAPPESLSPASARFIREMSYDDRAFTAAVVNLAVKGFLEIRENDGDYTLIRRDNDGQAPLAPGERVLLSHLFRNGTVLVLDQANYKRIGKARAAHRRALRLDHEKIHFFTNSSLLVPAIIGGLLTLALVAASGGATPIALVVIGLIAVAIVVFHSLLKAATPRGRELLDRLDGFRLYLDVAERDDLNLRNPPDKTPDLFERFLPFALALGVEQAWAEQFADVFASLAGEGQSYRPGWYHGDFDAGRVGKFSSGMGKSLTQAIAASARPPGSSSGSGGGGFSGGGGGGGGGGGW